MKHFFLSLIAALIVAGIMTGLGYRYYRLKIEPSWTKLQKQVTLLDQAFKISGAQSVSSTADQTKTIADLQSQIKNLETEKTKLIKLTKSLSDPNAPATARDNTLTTLVAKATASVVSVVISKDVPQLEVIYTNPFGDDPVFKNLNIQIPTYRQKGTEHKKVGAGTGFFISSDGYIVTNKHVVSDDQADYTVLTSTGVQKNAKVMYRDTNQDLAIIKVDGTGYQKISLGDSDALKLGQTVIAIGNALGEYNNSISVGIVSGLNRSIQAQTGNQGQVEQLSGVIQTDAGINPGNSGGPLLDLAGHAIGVNVATVLGSQSIGFSVPINRLAAILTQLKIH